MTSVHMNTPAETSKRFVLVNKREHEPFGRNTGYVIGYHTYRREDNAVFTEEDLEELKTFNLGQQVRVVGQEGEFTAKVHYVCDST